MLEALSADAQFSTFVGLAQSIGFAANLDAPSPPFTLFAPTNAAFDAMTPEERAAWIDDVDGLRSLLAYHAVDADAGVLTDPDLRTMSGRTLRSQQGTLLTVGLNGSAIAIEGGSLGAEIPASNGIVHAIDTVLLPTG